MIMKHPLDETIYTQLQKKPIGHFFGAILEK